MDLKNIKFDKSKINPNDIEEIKRLTEELTNNKKFIKKLKKWKKKNERRSKRINRYY